MDRYVLVVYFNQKEENYPTEDLKPLEPVQQIFDRLSYISCQQSTRAASVFPACSLNGSPSVQKWYFAIQACQGSAQFCSPEWEELERDVQKGASEDASPNVMESCLQSLSDQEKQEHDDQSTMTELFEEAAEGLHQLSDKLPPPGKALLDVLILGCTEHSPGLKDVLPLMGALKHMFRWHAAKMSLITQYANGWQKVASYLNANMVESAEMDSCINHREVWRGGLLIREKKCVSELQFEGFSLCSTDGPGLLRTHDNTTDHKQLSEVFHYYRPVLDLVQLVNLSDLPSYMLSSTQFRLALTGKSVKAKMLLDQLRSLRGKVGGLFCLSCVVTPIAQPPASQLSSQRWKEFLARRPKSLPVPEMEVKGESAHYLLLLQGSEDDGDGSCKVTMLHSAKQINGAAAMATVSGLLQEKSLSSPGRNVGDQLCSLPFLHGNDLLKREKKITQVQTLAVKEYLKRRAEASAPTTMPVDDLRVLLNLAREQYLKMNDASATAPRLQDVRKNMASKTSERECISSQPSEWPERSVLHNIENLQRRRQQKRVGLSGPGSSDSLLGPKDVQKTSTAPLDARELLKHFTPDGNPAGELQPLLVLRGSDNVFQLSPELTPRKVSKLPFRQASTSHYHGIEFCLDEQRALDRDRGFVRLQSRLIRYETQTTCSKEPCPVPFALSPAPSPAVMSEPGSVPDGEMLKNADVARLKRMSWDADVTGGHSRKRLAKSESSDSLGSQSSASSGTHPSVKLLRQQPVRSHSASSSLSTSASVTKRTSSSLVNPSTADKPRPPQQKTSQGQSEEKLATESRSQKHQRMLKEVVAKTLKHHGITAEHKCFNVCSKKLFEISKFYLKDLKTSRGLHEEMKKAASVNAKQVIDWELEKASSK